MQALFCNFRRKIKMFMNEAAKMMIKESISGKSKAVYQYLAYRSDKGHKCWPSLKMIAKECGYSVSTVQRALRELLDSGYIRKEHRYQGGMQTSNLYELIIEAAERIKAALDNAWQRYFFWKRRLATIEANKKQVQMCIEEPKAAIKQRYRLFLGLFKLPNRT
jgi:DNA-binding MarR family transcriptional regulator